MYSNRRKSMIYKFRFTLVDVVGVYGSFFIIISIFLVKWEEKLVVEI